RRSDAHTTTLGAGQNGPRAGGAAQWRSGHWEIAPGASAARARGGRAAYTHCVARLALSPAERPLSRYRAFTAPGTVAPGRPSLREAAPAGGRAARLGRGAGRGRAAAGGAAGPPPA